MTDVLVCSDLDGSVDAAPAFFEWLFTAVRQAGGQVAILTGVKTDAAVSPADVQAKRDYLAQLGVTAYDTLAVFPDDDQLPFAKARWCERHGADVLIENNRANAQAASDTCLVLVTWATRVGKKKAGET